MLEKIKCPFRDDVHRMHEERYGSRAWMDIYGIKYRVIDNTLIITSPRENQLIPPTIIDHINALPDEVKVVFNLGYDFSTTGLNLLLELSILGFITSFKNVIISCKHSKFEI